MKNSFTTILVTLLFSPLVNAGQKLSCDMAPSDGKAQIEILNVEGRSDLKVMQVDLISKIYPNNNAGGDLTKPAHLIGQLVGQINGEGYIYASGVVSNAPGAELIVNPEAITVQGNLTPLDDGSFVFTLLDEDRLLQRGFGAYLTCTVQK